MIDIKTIKESQSRLNKSFLIYSAHDTNVANIVNQIFPNFNFTFVPYASSIIFEVFKITEKNALKDEKSKTIYVRSIFNGQSIEIEGCYNTFN
jgi:hypothetical protein